MAMNKDAKLIAEGKVVRDNLRVLKEQYVETWDSLMSGKLKQMVGSILEVDAKIAKSRKAPRPSPSPSASPVADADVDAPGRADEEGCRVSGKAPPRTKRLPGHSKGA